MTGARVKRVIASTAVAIGLAALPTVQAHASTGPQVQADCHHGSVKPKALRLSCNTTFPRVVGIHWSKWEATKARGTGTLETVVHGHQRNTPVTVALNTVFAKTNYFTKAVVIFGKGRTPRTYSLHYFHNEITYGNLLHQTDKTYDNEFFTLEDAVDFYYDFDCSNDPDGGYDNFIVWIEQTDERGNLEKVALAANDVGPSGGNAGETVRLAGHGYAYTDVQTSFYCKYTINIDGELLH
jgi:hypothetical protein